MTSENNKRKNFYIRPAELVYVVAAMESYIAKLMVDYDDYLDDFTDDFDAYKENDNENDREYLKAVAKNKFEKMQKCRADIKEAKEIYDTMRTFQVMLANRQRAD